MEKTVFITTNPKGQGTEVSLHIESPELRALLDRIQKLGAGIKGSITPTHGSGALESLAEFATTAHALAKSIESEIRFYDSVVRKQLTWKAQQAEERDLSSVLVLSRVLEKPNTVKAIMDKYMKPRGFKVDLSHLLK